jgi:Protein of unknown function (DUF3500)
MQRLMFVLVALLLAGLARFDGLSSPAAQTSTAAEGTMRAVTAANAFLATLSPAERSKVVLELRPDLQSRWSNLPTGTVMQVDRERTKTPLPRNGLRLGDLSATQRDAIQALLRSTLSADGLQKVNDIVASDEELERRQGPSRPPTAAVRFGRAEYYIAILGTPSASAPWMLQFGGHHLAINVSYVGANRTLAPTHLGAQPALFTLESRTVRPLGDELDKAVALLTALDARQRQQATLGYAVADTVLAAGSDGKTIEPEGVRASTFTPAQRQMLTALIGEWVRVADDAAAAARMKEIESTLAETYFAWSGPPTKEGGAYFRIQGPAVVIEYAPQALQTRGPDGAPEHIHTIYRDPTNDYGRKFARR